MCDGLMYSIADVCEVYKGDINMGDSTCVSGLASMCRRDKIWNCRLKGLRFPLSYGLVYFSRQMSRDVQIQVPKNKNVLQ